MQLVSIRENEIRVDLDWADVKLLAYIIRHAISHDVGSTSANPTLYVSYADTALAFLEAAGLASWAHTVEEKDYTLEEFALTACITPEEEARWEQQCREAKQTAPVSAKGGA